MGVVTLNDEIRSFVEAQPVYFVGTAPLSETGHINVSPKGGSGTFIVLDDARIAYLDIVGSGIETVAHLKENGRIVVMFCAWSGRPRIVRFHGSGRAYEEGSSEFDELIGRFPSLPGRRAVVVIDVERTSSSCGFGVPLMDFVADRSEMGEWCEKKGVEGLERYRASKNARSLDGLEGLGFPSASPD